MITQLLDDASGTIILDDAFFSAMQARELESKLVQELPWTIHRVRMFGRELPAPRLSSWHGDADTYYRYSGATHQPAAWTRTLLDCRDRLQSAWPGTWFNSVLANLYRNGQDCMGWHSDDEPELGRDPVIASLSFGAEREFLLRQRGCKSEQRRVMLTAGSLLLMAGATQHHWQHALPRRAKVHTARLNLTFRRVMPRC